MKSSPAAVLILEALGLPKGSGTPPDTVGHLTVAQLEAIAKMKEKDLNAFTLEAAVRIIAGTAKSMGITTDLNNSVSEDS